jgi:hypothetical protein
MELRPGIAFNAKISMNCFLHYFDFLFCQLVQLIHKQVDLVVGGFDLAGELCANRGRPLVFLQVEYLLNQCGELERIFAPEIICISF